MPQLEKVALVVGSTLVYANTYQQALADLEAIQKGQAPSKTTAPGATTVSSSSAVNSTAGAPSAPATSDARLDQIRTHLQRYRDLSAQGKWAEAGKELEAIDAAVRK
jgi:uncharacterized membrane protein (UPF0182 family)